MKAESGVMVSGVDSEPVPAELESSPRYSLYVVWLLCVVYALNMVDRQLLAILIEPIKREFALSDLYMGLLGGLAFALFYTTLGMPLARLADRKSRTLIIAASIAVWSGFTALTGFARSVSQLLLARVGVAVGEAGCNPAAYSLISDYFPKERRATALSIYQSGAVIGAFIGLLVGGYLEKLYGWRGAFFAIGIPGLLIALLVRLTIREPVRGRFDPIAMRDVELRPAREVLASLLRKPSFRHIAAAAALHNLAIFGVGNFYSSFLIRCHGMSVAEAGAKLGFVYLIGGIAGTYLGGAHADRLAQRKADPRYYLWVPATLLVVGLPFGQLTYTLDGWPMLLCMLLAVGAASTYLAPSIAATYQLVPSSERALSSALLLLILNLIGLGLGPVVSGLVSDSLNHYFQQNGVEAARAQAEGLRWALRLVSLASVWSAAHYFLAARHLRRDALAGV